MDWSQAAIQARALHWQLVAHLDDLKLGQGASQQLGGSGQAQLGVSVCRSAGRFWEAATGSLPGQPRRWRLLRHVSSGPAARAGHGPNGYGARDGGVQHRAASSAAIAANAATRALAYASSAALQ